MHSVQSLREIRAMEQFLYGGLSREEFYSIPRRGSQPIEGEVIGYLEYDLKTGELTHTDCYKSRNDSQGKLESEKV